MMKRKKNLTFYLPVHIIDVVVVEIEVDAAVARDIVVVPDVDGVDGNDALPIAASR